MARNQKLIGADTNRLNLIHYALIALLALFVYQLFNFLIATLLSYNPGLDSDEYLHAVPPHELSVLLSRGDFEGFFARLAKEVFYPPLHAISLSIPFFIFGSSAFLARICSLLFFMGAIFASAFGAYRILRVQDFPKSLLSLSLVLGIAIAVSTPIGFLISSLVMIEPLGMLGVSLLLALLVQLDQKNSFLVGLLLGIILFLLFLSKHTLPILVIPGLVIAILLEDIGNVRKSSGGSRMFSKRNKTVLFALAFTFFLWAAWALSVNEKAMYRFLFGHHARGYVIGLSKNLFYLKSLFFDFHLLSPIAIFSVPAAIYGAIRFYHKISVRYALYSLLCSCVLLGGVSEQGPRHLVMLAPCLWLLVMLGSADCFRSLSKYSHYLAISIVGILLLSLLASFSMYQIELQARLTRVLEIKPDQDAAIDLLVSAIAEDQNYAVIGDQFLAFPYTLDWRIAVRDSLLLAEARTKRIHFPQSIKDKIQKIDMAQAEEVIGLMNSLSQKDWSSLLLIKRKDAPFAQAYDGVSKHECSQENRFNCEMFETSDFYLLKLNRVKGVQ